MTAAEFISKFKAMPEVEREEIFASLLPNPEWPEELMMTQKIVIEAARRSCFDHFLLAT